MSPFHLSVLLTLAPLGSRGGVVESPALDVDSVPREAPELDLHVRGSPLAGETLQVEVRGLLATPLVVLVDQLPAELGPLDARSVEGLLPGSRAARPTTRARARASSRPLVLRGTTDGSGLCTWPLTAPEAGTRLLLRGFAASPWPREFEALELDILPRPASGPVVPTITPSSGGPTSIPPGQ